MRFFVSNFPNISSFEPYAISLVNSDTTPFPNLSETNRVEAICAAYNELIDLETERYNNPIHLKIDEKRIFDPHAKKPVKTALIRSYHYVSKFSLKDYQEKLDRITRQLEKLDAYKFMEAQENESKFLNQMKPLFLKWIALVEKNLSNFAHVQKKRTRLESSPII